MAAHQYTLNGFHFGGTKVDQVLSVSISLLKKLKFATAVSVFLHLKAFA